MRHRDRPRAVLIGGGGHISSSSSSSSSSDFEFTISLSPSSRRSQLCPADDLFYKGKLLPLHLSPRISMVRTLLLASSSTSSSSDATASRDSTASSSSSAFSEFESSRPSSVTEDDAKRSIPRRPNYFSSFATRFSSVFHAKLNNKKDSPQQPLNTDHNIKKSTTKEVIKKYVKKMKPFYEKLSSRDQKKTFSFSIRRDRSSSSNFAAGSIKKDEIGGQMGIYSHSQSFSGNLSYPRRKRCAGSCPSSMRSSPSHSGLLYDGGGGAGGFPDPSASSGFSSSMEELQSAIQGAIAHCKSTMIRGA